MKPTILWPLVGTFPISFEFEEAPKWYTDVFGYPHNGIDIACPIGNVVRATDDGQVIFNDCVPDKDGKGLILSHPWGLSLYWHLSEITANYADVVKKGDPIGKSGNTGFSTGPHLHFGIKVYGMTPTGMRGWSNPREFFDTCPIDPAPPWPINRTYRVLWGDTLWKIAQKFYGDGTQWRHIYNANIDKISNPNLIRPLQVLIIP